VGVVTDSNADLPSDLQQQLGIVVVPLIVHFGHQQYRDGVDITSHEFFARLRAGGVLPTTSQISVGDWRASYLKAIEQIRVNGQEPEGVVVATIASNLSGTYNAACTAAEGLSVPIEVIDSRQISVGTGWLAITAARAAREGRPFAEIVAQLRDMVPRLRVFGMLDSLDHAQRGGRIGKGAALLGTLLNVKPMLQVRDGEVLPIGRVRTRQRALQRVVELAEEEAPLEELAVLHSDFPEAAAELAAMVTHLVPSERIFIADIGPVLGTHIGPGAMGLACVTHKT
jgi:DegV family protein with EDD domain